MISIHEITTKNYISTSKLPDADYVINPYVGCPHKCIYCYAEFMKRFTKHTEEWGEFLDVKFCENSINLRSIPNDSTILIGSVTDAYNPFEKKYETTKKILQQLEACNCNVDILTKSDLVLRDIDIIKKIPHSKVGLSINSLDDNFRKLTEPHAPSIQKRINALKLLNESGIKTYLFMSPIFPEITKFKPIIEAVNNDVDYVCFENLNLRGAYLERVLNLIRLYYPENISLYNSIYHEKDTSYWEILKEEIIDFCTRLSLDYKIYFYHDKIKKH